MMNISSVGEISSVGFGENIDIVLFNLNIVFFSSKKCCIVYVDSFNIYN